jgi:hypothetical protein
MKGGPGGGTVAPDREKSRVACRYYLPGDLTEHAQRSFVDPRDERVGKGHLRL